MDKYVLRLCLVSDNFLFPRFAKSSTGVMTVCKVPIGYGNAREELHCVLSELSLPQVWDFIWQMVLNRSLLNMLPGPVAIPV